MIMRMILLYVSCFVLHNGLLQMLSLFTAV